MRQIKDTNPPAVRECGRNRAQPAERPARAAAMADHRIAACRIASSHARVPREYNAARDLIERNLGPGRASRVAFIDDRGTYTYEDLAQRVRRCGGALQALGIPRGERVMLCLHDGIDFPTVFLGSILAGIVPVPVNTLLAPADYAHVLRDSGARALVVSEALLSRLAPLVGAVAGAVHVIVAGGRATPYRRLADLLARTRDGFAAAPTGRNDPCFWLYSSGSTGPPKGTVHRHASLIQTAEHFGRVVVGIGPDDVSFSAAKLSFAYGLGNGLTFPLSAGATSILMAERPTPENVFDRLRKYQPTLFYAVPSIYAHLLAHADLPAPCELRLRRCLSAGEALPPEIGRRWAQRFGVDILDGLGSTEMLHSFLSNRAGDVEYGTSGRPVPGYELRIVGEKGDLLGPGQVGDLHVRGPSQAIGYWNQHEKTRATFLREWTRCGDKYYVNEAGRYVHAGRSDDMLKVNGLFVSPMEVEAALTEHPAVLEAAVVGRRDAAGLVKPAAYIVLKDDSARSEEVAAELRDYVRKRLATYKYPRWIEFIDELPRTPTGKIQRFRLRAAAEAREAAAAPQ